MAVLAAAGALWTGVGSTTAGAATAGTVIGAAAEDPGSRLPEGLYLGNLDDHKDRDRQCASTTAWGTGDCPHRRLN
ncbi:hypothetical protein ACS04_30310 [Streptomyces roseus]|uniref:Uncharacterized protein n=2 Tax=Streptomyces roseus TaxID=66430 RepID=A0A0J6XHV8_9ACTN|nr:hypothetical protein ACS04_30310 [Streptomyces roseus]